jgi:hypothetical protein
MIVNHAIGFHEPNLVVTDKTASLATVAAKLKITRNGPAWES